MDTSPVPLAPGAVPLLGHAPRLAREPLAFLARLAARPDRLVRIKLGPAAAVLVCDPDLADEVFREDRLYDKGGVFIERARDVVGDSLSNCPHHLHRRQRRLAQPSFSPVRLRGYAAMMATQIDGVVDAWRDGESIDVNEQMSRLTLNVLTATLFSDSLPEHAVRAAYDDVEAIVAGVLRRMAMPTALTRLPLPANRRFDRAVTRLRRTVEDLLAERRATGTDRGDFLSALLAARDPDTGDALSDAEIADQVLAFLLAGTETTASVLSWAHALIATHPTVARRLRAEVDSVLSGRPATQDDIPNLGYTGQVIQETLRLRAPAWLLTRELTADTTLGGHHLKAGTTVAYSPFVIHHRPDLYPDPERFDPHRWSPDRTPPPRTAFIPFAAGARRCIGDRFALIEAALALATITARWDLELPEGSRVRPAAAIVLRPKDLHMRTVRRTPPASVAPAPEHDTGRPHSGSP
ncbi:cytochrome P450 [Actinokineospora auranticolor]|uniref:Pentalenene oxygenase n=1 Tax=Actinokineospora auranticolor TaxID=155976 RepID=A0A2S6GPF5_9PSEU|nr:cytochrome P450 [Actinokineospora auranticolor]PPK67076.1 pentalenene oxygenase [Actinokineospora auranticolor]